MRKYIYEIMDTIITSKFHTPRKDELREFLTLRSENFEEWQILKYFEERDLKVSSIPVATEEVVGVINKLTEQELNERITELENKVKYLQGFPKPASTTKKQPAAKKSNEKISK